MSQPTTPGPPHSQAQNRSLSRCRCPSIGCRGQAIRLGCHDHRVVGAFGVEKKCFGSAGCGVTYRIKPAKYVGTKERN